MAIPLVLHMWNALSGPRCTWNAGVNDVELAPLFMKLGRGGWVMWNKSLQDAKSPAGVSNTQ